MSRGQARGDPAGGESSPDRSGDCCAANTPSGTSPRLSPAGAVPAPEPRTRGRGAPWRLRHGAHLDAPGGGRSVAGRSRAQRRRGACSTTGTQPTPRPRPGNSTAERRAGRVARPLRRGRASGHRTTSLTPCHARHEPAGRPGRRPVQAQCLPPSHCHGIARDATGSRSPSPLTSPPGVRA